MSLVKIAPAGWCYYADELARGREDYYAAAAEHPGRFVGRGAEALGLSGIEASAPCLERLFGHGADPRDGTALGRGFTPKDEKVIAGFGVTFSAPKSVSVLWACGGTAITAEVLAAHDAAVDEALAFLDEHTAFTRRGHGGVHQVDTDGLIARASPTAPHAPLIHSSTPTSFSPTRSVPPTVRGSPSTPASSTSTRRRPGCSTRRPFAPS
jgi:hypothetical protein